MALIAAMAALLLLLSIPALPGWRGQPGDISPIFIYARPDPEVLRFGESSTIWLELFNVGDSPAEIRGFEIFGSADPAISGAEAIGSFPMILPPKGNATARVILRTSGDPLAPEGGRALIIRAIGADASCPAYIWLVRRKAELRAEARAAFGADGLSLEIFLENSGDGPASGPPPSVFPPEVFEPIKSPGASGWELGPGERTALKFEFRNSTALSRGLWEIPISIHYATMGEGSDAIAGGTIECVAKFRVDSGGSFAAFQAYGSSLWEVRYRVKVAPAGGLDQARLKLRLPPNNAHQEVVSETLDPPPDSMEADRFGNRMAVWALGERPGDRGLEVEYRGLVAARWIRTRPPPNGSAAPSGDWGPLLEPEPMVESGSEEIRSAAEGFEGSDAFLVAARIFEFVQRGIRYVPHSPKGWLAREPMGQGALMTLRTKFGICTDKADLLVALYRARGLPARRSVGAVVGGFPPSQGHAWVEVWIPGCGFVPCDPTNDLSFGEISQREICLYYGQGLSIMPAEIEGGRAELGFEMSIGEAGAWEGTAIPAQVYAMAPLAAGLALAMIQLLKRHFKRRGPQ